MSEQAGGTIDPIILRSLLKQFCDNPAILFNDSRQCWGCSGPYRINKHAPDCILIAARRAIGLPDRYWQPFPHQKAEYDAAEASFDDPEFQTP